MEIARGLDAASIDQRNFREAVHLILAAISRSVGLRSKMIMKGGMLMAIRYDSTRITRDADFSTTDKHDKGSEVALLEMIDDLLWSY